MHHLFSHESLTDGAVVIFIYFIFLTISRPELRMEKNCILKLTLMQQK